MIAETGDMPLLGCIRSPAAHVLELPDGCDALLVDGAQGWFLATTSDFL